MGHCAASPTLTASHFQTELVPPSPLRGAVDYGCVLCGSQRSKSAAFVACAADRKTSSVGIGQPASHPETGFPIRVAERESRGSSSSSSSNSNSRYRDAADPRIPVKEGRVKPKDGADRCTTPYGGTCAHCQGEGEGRAGSMTGGDNSPSTWIESRRWRRSRHTRQSESLSAPI